MRPPQPGIMAAVVESNDDRSVSALVHVEFACDGPLPADDDRWDGRWIVRPQGSLTSRSTRLSSRPKPSPSLSSSKVSIHVRHAEHG